MAERIVVVGGGQAGARTAAALRDEGWQEEIVLLGSEDDAPYERPPLSKEVLVDDVDPLRATIFSRGRYVEMGIDLRTGVEVLAIDGARREVITAEGAIDYSKLVLATGCKARAMNTPGVALKNIFQLRTAKDARAIRSLLQPGAAVVLVGGGFIGLEVAASAIRRGCSVTILENGSQLMGRVINPMIAEVVASMHRSHGVTVRLGVWVVGFDGLGTMRRIELSDGSVIDADLVVVGIGALANDGLARKAGIECADGVLVDESARSSMPDVYAVGDVARHRYLAGASGVRLESWENAELQAKAAARAIVGVPAIQRGVPWFWTDQYDMNLQILGLRNKGEASVIRSTLEDRSWSVFTISDGRIVGACLANAGRDRRVVSQLMSEGRRIDVGDLADVQRPLKSLLQPA